MNIYTIGFTKKNAECFFELLKENKIDLLLDIRLNNKSQLAGFTKGNDLEYFLKQICKCDYLHYLWFTPTTDILDNYKAKKISWQEYETQYNKLIETRKEIKNFEKQFRKYKNICLLCSEPTPEQCHRRLAAEKLCKDNPNLKLKHL